LKVILLESDIKKNMIIECINCNKKFNVNSELIPSNGRHIQCGSCNHTWHYKIEEVTSKPLILDKIEIPLISKVSDKKEITDNKNLSNDKPSKIPKQEINNTKNTNNRIENKSISNFFSYLLVFVISFVALVILIDTLKSPLINIFPQLKIVLFNLFETLKDVKLFIIDLT
jgi:predicted Zn finger-like uncharacterized protein